MSLYVNTNLSSLNARRSLAVSAPALDTSFQRLASGFRINSAADDAAGLQISNRLTSLINGLNQGIRNANDGISLAQTVESGLDELTNMAQRMRTLVIQSRSGINSQADKTAIQQEIRQLNQEITRIAESTTFAGIPLLDGTLDRDIQVGANAGQTININLESELGFTADGLRLSEIVVDGTAGINSAAVTGQFNPTGTTFSVPGISGTIFGLEASVNGEPFALLQEPVGSPYAGAPTPGQVTFGNNASINALILGQAVREGTGVNLQASISGNTFTLINNSTVQFRLSGSAPDEATALANQAFVMALTGLSAEQVGIQPFQIAPPEDEDLITRLNLQIIDEAISTIDSARAKLGAIQNRLQSTIRNQANIEENLSAARSRIRDTDYAKETAVLIRTQIIQQSSTTVLAQANQRPQVALSLLQ